MHRAEPSDSADPGTRGRNDAALLWVIERSATPMVALGRDRRVREANAAFVALVDSSRARLIGRRFDELLVLGSHEDVGSAKTIRLRTSGGGNVLCDCETTEGDALEIIVVHPPRTPEPTRQGALSELVVGLGHEINNPLTYVLANTELVREELRDLAARRPGTSDADVLHELDAMLDDVEQGAHKIRRLMRDLRSLANVDDTPRARIEVAGLIDSALRDSASVLADRSPVVVEMGSSRRIFGSEAQLRRALVCLLTNAAQSLDQPPRAGEISISCEAARGGVTIEIADLGRGIPQALLAEIFEPFSKAHGPSASAGLGLAVAREIVSAHGGTIAARSVPSRGSTFSVWLPEAPVIG